MVATTFVPVPVAQSSAEAEYNACAFALTESIYVKHVWNFLHGKHLDMPITFAVFSDSKSAILTIRRVQDELIIVHLSIAVLSVLQDLVQADSPTQLGEKRLKKCLELRVPDRVHNFIALVTDCRYWGLSAVGWNAELMGCGLFHQCHGHSNDVPDESTFDVMDECGKVRIRGRAIFVPTFGC